MKRLIWMLVLMAGSLYGQKHAIGEEDYRRWKTISNPQISSDGSLITYESKPLLGNGTLYIHRINPLKVDSFQRAEALHMSKKGDLVVFKVSPDYDTLRKLKLKKVKKTKWPMDSIVVFDLAKDSMEIIPDVYSYTLAEKGKAIAFLQKENISTELTWFKALFSRKEKLKKEKVLKVYADYPTLSFETKKVKEFSLSEDGTQVAYIEKVEHEESEKELERLLIRNTRTGEVLLTSKTEQEYKLPVWSESMNKVVYFVSSDTSLSNYEMKIHSMPLSTYVTIGDTLSLFIDSEKVPAPERKPFFSKDENLLFFGVKERAYEEPEDSLLEEEKYHVDIWHYEDQKIQPRQLKELPKKKKRSDLYLYDFSYNEARQLSNDTLQVMVRDQHEGFQALAYSNEPYAVESQWSYPWRRDYYLQSLRTGENRLVKKNMAYAGSLSSEGRYFTYFDEQEREHRILDLYENSDRCITCGTDSVQWVRDINGMPFDPGPVGSYGFTRDGEYLFRSEWDIWSFDVLRDTLICLTEKQGQNRRIELRLMKKSSDSVYIDIPDTYVYGLNKGTKSMHLFTWLRHQDHFDLLENAKSPHRFHSLIHSEDRSTVLLRRSSVKEYPDIYVCSSTFESPERISNVNPQQAELYWPTVELVKWMSYDSLRLEGLVYLPEGYDTSKSYPLMIYYYELNADKLHNYRSPKPSASIINPIEYASNDYVVFVPDIRYETGYPARSAYNSIMSGTDFILKNYAVDSLRMGLQGQSWGGYQTAQLITMTNRYAAAMAGAPVSNMFSAYGGIRWGSGLNRQFQYEATQSRIGKTIWEAPDLYIENSPLFHLPKVSTPLLIMHNDKDGAVPWYQGIELYTGMRRLQKPCWMLVYNNDYHNLQRLANKFDLSIRMNQFFDHYLKDAPMPIWMKEGIPAIDKGTKSGYELEEE